MPVRIVMLTVIAGMLGALAFPSTAAAQQRDGRGLLEFVEIERTAAPYGQPQAVQLVGDKAYLANGEGGLVIIDIAAAQPKVVGRWITGNLGRDSIGREWIHEYRGLATAISVSGKFAFLLTQSKGYDISRSKVLRIDISHANNPAPAGECLLNGAAVDLVAIDETHVCVLGGAGSASSRGTNDLISIVDFSDAGRERIIATGGLPKLPGPKPPRPAHFTPQRLLVAHGLALVSGVYPSKDPAQTPAALHIFSLADPAAPAYVATCNIGQATSDMAVDRAGAFVYVISGTNLMIVDLSDPLVPRIAQTLSIPGGEASAIVVNGKKGYLSTAGGIVIMNLSDPVKPAFDPLRSVGLSSTAIASDGRRIFIADPSRGLAVFDVAGRGLGKPLWVKTAGHNLHQVANAGAPTTQSATQPATRLQRTADVDGNTIYVPADGLGLRIYDRPHPLDSSLICEFPIPVEPRWRERLDPYTVVVQNKFAYLATGRDGLRIIDVSDRAKPVLLGHFYDSIINRMAVIDVKVRDAKAYLADLDNGLYVVDVSNPKLPVQLAHYHTGNAHSIDLAGNIAIIADGVYGLSAIDISDAQRPRLVGRYHARDIRFDGATVLPTPANGPTTIAVADAGYLRTMKLVPTDHLPVEEGPIELVSHVKVPMGIPDGLRVSDDGSTLYLAADEGWNLTAIDIRDPRKMQMLSVSATGGFCHGIALYGKFAYATNNYDACTIFNVADPAKPVLAGAVMGMTRCLSAAIGNGALGLRTHDGLLLADLADPVNPRLQGKVEGIGTEFTIVRHDQRRYLLGLGAEGLHVVDASDLAKPRRIALIPIQGAAGLTVRGKLAYVTRNQTAGRIKTNDLLVIPYSIANPQIIATLEVPATLGRLAAAGDTLYIGGDQLTVVNIADPTQPTIVSHIDFAHHEGTYSGEIISDVAAFRRNGRDLVAVVDHFWGVRLFDASDKTKLVELSEFAVSGGDFTGIQAAKNRVYVSNNWGGIYFIDTANPLRPQILGSTRRLFSPAQPPGHAPGEMVNTGSSSGLIAGDLLYYQGNTDYTLRIADIHDPSHPRLLSEFPPPKESKRPSDDRRFGSAYPQLRGSYLYTPGYARILDVSNPKKPSIVGECREAGFENGACLLADINARPYLILCSSDALKIVDIHDPAKPTLIGNLPGDYEGGYYFGRGIRADGPILYVLNRHQFNTVDISDPTHPRRLASLELSGFCSDVQIANGLAYVAAYYDGLHVIDIRNPKTPIPIDHFQQGVYQDDAAWDNIACYQSLDIAGDYAYVTEYYSGMLVLRLGPEKR